MNCEQSRNRAQSKLLTVPNLLSLFRLCLIPLFMWLYCVRRENLWTGAVLLLAGLTDVVDGFIAGAAAAIAIGIRPGVRDMLVGSHSSFEPGHRILMNHLNIPTYLDLGLRLGEGTGAVLLYPLIDASVRILTEMRTLKELDINR